VPRAWAARRRGYLSHLLADCDAGRLRLAGRCAGPWALPLCRSGSPFEPLVVALAMSLAWCALPERPDPRAALQRVGLRLDLGAERLP
jgi:inner membrane protein